MKTITKLGLVLAAGMMTVAPGFSNQVYLSLNTGTSTAAHTFGNIADLCACYPNAGTVNDASPFGTQVGFDLSSGKYEELLTGDTLFAAGTITNPTAIYMLINVFIPADNQQVLSISINGTGGATQGYTLVNNQDTRNYFYQGTPSVTPLSSVNSANFFTSANSNTVGHPIPNNLGVQQSGTWIIDEVKLVLNDPSWTTGGPHNLTSIGFAVQADENFTIGGNGNPVLFGLTVAAPDVAIESVTPEPGTIAMGFGGVALILIGRRRFAR